MKISGAIFDMDGTLLNSMQIWTCIGERYLATKGLLPKEDINYIFLNNKLSYSINYVKKQYELEESEEQILAEARELLRKFYMEEMTIKNHVFEFLTAMKADGVKMCVATATDAPLAELALKKAGIFDFFEAVYSCHTVGKSKEVPDIYEISLEHLGTSKSETFVFEDALYAATTAKKAAFPVIGIYDSTEKKQEQLKELVDSYYENYQQLLLNYHKRNLTI